MLSLSTAARFLHRHALFFLHTDSDHLQLSSLLLCRASVCLGGCGTGAFLEPHAVLTFRRLISCDRCIPPGGVEFECFVFY